MKYNIATIRRYKNKGQDELFNKALMQRVLKNVNKRTPKIDFGGLRDNSHFLVPDCDYEF